MKEAAKEGAGSVEGAESEAWQAKEKDAEQEVAEEEEAEDWTEP